MIEKCQFEGIRLKEIAALYAQRHSLLVPCRHRPIHSGPIGAMLGCRYDVSYHRGHETRKSSLSSLQREPAVPHNTCSCHLHVLADLSSNRGSHATKWRFQETGKAIDKLSIARIKRRIHSNYPSTCMRKIERSVRWEFEKNGTGQSRLAVQECGESARALRTSRDRRLGQAGDDEAT